MVVFCASKIYIGIVFKVLLILLVFVWSNAAGAISQGEETVFFVWIQKSCASTNILSPGLNENELADENVNSHLVLPFAFQASSPWILNRGNPCGCRSDVLKLPFYLVRMLNVLFYVRCKRMSPVGEQHSDKSRISRRRTGLHALCVRYSHSTGQVSQTVLSVFSSRTSWSTRKLPVSNQTVYGITNLISTLMTEFKRHVCHNM